jgi:hypothetical protein
MAGAYAVSAADDLICRVRQYLLQYWTLKLGRNVLRVDYTLIENDARVNMQVVISAGTPVDVSHIGTSAEQLDSLMSGAPNVISRADLLRLEYIVCVDSARSSWSAPIMVEDAASSSDVAATIVSSTKRVRYERVATPPPPPAATDNGIARSTSSSSSKSRFASFHRPMGWE